LLTRFFWLRNFSSEQKMFQFEMVKKMFFYL
jgi:hypothetical protein